MSTIAFPPPIAGIATRRARDNAGALPAPTHPFYFNLQRRIAEAGTPWLASIPLALEPFSQRFAVSADRLRLLTHSALRRLLVCPPPLHLAENAFALHLFLQYPQCRIDVIVADENLHQHRSYCCDSQVNPHPR